MHFSFFGYSGDVAEGGAPSPDLDVLSNLVGVHKHCAVIETYYLASGEACEGHAVKLLETYGTCSLDNDSNIECMDDVVFGDGEEAFVRGAAEILSVLILANVIVEVV